MGGSGIWPGQVGYKKTINHPSGDMDGAGSLGGEAKAVYIHSGVNSVHMTFQTWVCVLICGLRKDVEASKTELMIFQTLRAKETRTIHP